ncbi:excinuclease ABC subunit A [Otariodibacter sp.]|uniref:excinuclease ABC subunit A n=1 Tax=Otariodibacter sp. TaxID=3030919 RepID=UPI0026329582|nr:excinuclease ABC subunit A [Otariodibacter sp.]
MKLIKPLVVAFSVTLIAACAPKDTVHYYSIQDALNSPQAKQVLDPNIQLSFAKQASGKVLQSGLVSNKKTNAVNKTDKEACEWAFLSAVKQFQETAKSNGATKVGNLVSYYKKNTYTSSTQFECHTGNIIGGVALKGDIVK